MKQILPLSLRADLRLAALVAVLALALPGRVTAQTFTILHVFYPASDGINLGGGLILSSNTLYGTTSQGGSSGIGTVFKLNTDGTDFTLLHTFSPGSGNVEGFYTNSDGAISMAGLILSSNTLYGTAWSGGTSGIGTVFKLKNDGTGFTTLHTFTNGNDGAQPYGGLILLGGTLYGTTSAGALGNGTVFKLNTDGTGFTTLYSFTGNTGGAEPDSALMLSGNTLYGTAAAAGNSGDGTVFKLNTDGTGFTTLHIFSGPDGANSYGALLLVGNTLYGTTEHGGPVQGVGEGTVFKISTDGTGFTNLYFFTANDDPYPNSDGAFPNGGLILSDGILYGTASEGGSADGGTVFKINTDGTGFRALYTFNTVLWPGGGLIVSGNTLYGTAAGAVFSLTLPMLIVTTIALHNGTNGVAYSQQLSAANGQLPYSWIISSGVLPPGLTLATSGLISGIPTTNGPFNFTVEVRDPFSATATQALTLTVSTPSLVLNGGFETGSFSDWTTSGNFTSTYVGSTDAHSGADGAQMGPSGSLGFISQTLATTAGASYLLSFWLDSPDGKTPNEFLASWNGNTLLDLINLPATGWTNIQFGVTATGNNTVLQFGFRDDPSYLGLDDISVVRLAVTLPPVILSAPQSTAGNTNFTFLLSGPAGSNYVVQVSTNLLNWSSVSTSTMPVSGTMTLSNAINGYNRRFYRAFLQ